MKKILKILGVLVVIMLLLLVGWYFLLRDPDVPAGESIRNILPFGSGEGVDIPPTTDNQQPTTGEEFGVVDGRPVQNLFRIHDAPVAGFVILREGASTTVRYVDRATGHIHDARLSDLERTRITNTTLPKIYEAVFRPDGLSVLYRSLKPDDTVDNISIALTPPRPPRLGEAGAGDSERLYTPTATILRGEMKEPVAANSGNTLYYILEDSQAVVSSVFDGTGQRTLLSSPFISWRLSPYGNTLIIWTKASANVSGYAYRLGTNGSLAKILGPFNGLSVSTRPGGEGISYSYNDGNKVRLFARETQSSVNFEIFPVTLAEKCAWGEESGWMLYCGVPASGIGREEPDSWYKGITHFSDEIWAFDTRGDIADILSSPKKLFGADIDMYEPHISSDDGYLVFINRNDLTLWALRLE